MNILWSFPSKCIIPSQRLTLRHEACDRGMFADGAVDAAKFVLGKPAGLYNMTHLLEEA